MTASSNPRRVRRLAKKLAAQSPELFYVALDHPRFGLELRAILAPARIWTCPLCGRVELAEHAPANWLVVEPFTRVAACHRCAEVFA